MISAIMLAAAAAVQMPEIPSFSPTQCDQPTERDKIINDAATASALSDGAASYNAKWQTALDARMDQLGLTEKERGQIALTVMKSPAFDAAMKAGFAGASRLMADVDKITRSTDATANCRTIVHMTTLLPEILGRAQDQWLLFDAALDAEAARRARKN